MGKKINDISIINQGLSIHGTLSSRGRLIVNGTVKGTLSGETVEIGKTGAVYADAKVRQMTICGIFEGDVNVMEELVVSSSGTCSGKVVCKNLVVEAGGKLNATVTCVVPTHPDSERQGNFERAGNEKRGENAIG